MLSDTLIEGLEGYRIGSKIRALRASKSMGLAQLGDHTGLSAGMLSKLERGQAVPTLPTLMRVAMVFGVGLDHFFAPGEAAPLVELVRAADRLTLPNTPEGEVTYHFASLDYTVNGRRTEAFIADFPDAAAESPPHEHDAIEMIHVTQGWVELTIHGRMLRLEEGDTLTFDAGFPHSYRGQGQALVTLRPEI